DRRRLVGGDAGAEQAGDRDGGDDSDDGHHDQELDEGEAARRPAPCPSGHAAPSPRLGGERRAPPRTQCSCGSAYRRTSQVPVVGLIAPVVLGGMTPVDETQMTPLASPAKPRTPVCPTLIGEAAYT